MLLIYRVYRMDRPALLKRESGWRRSTHVVVLTLLQPPKNEGTKEKEQIVGGDEELGMSKIVKLK
jgi:hypothetical protein